ncbi:MAG: hypothetical protein IKJ14_04025 [Clostridia bacterium]|nr:hypothetical protein [Clostridia bacterium]
MKKFLLLFLIVYLIFPLTSFTAKAEIKGNIDDSVNDVLSGINDDDLNKITEYLNGILGEEKSIKDRIVEYITGDNAFNFNGFLSFIKNAIFSGFRESIGIVSIIIFIGILYSIINIINYKKHDNNGNNTIYFIFYSVALTLFIELIYKVNVVGDGLIKNLQKTVELSFPIMITLGEFSGGFGTMLFKPLSSIASLLSSNLFSNVFAPIISVCFICVLIGNLSETVRLNNLNKTLLSFIKWTLGVSTTIFTLFITAKGIVNSQYNGLSFKILKYATGSMIPIVGNFISGGLDVLTSSAILVKNSFGFISVICIIFNSLKAGFTLLSVSFILKFSVSICEPCLDLKFVKLTNGISEVFNVYTAILFFSGFVYAVTCFSIMNSTSLVI